jgi:hypothetical protein
MKKILENSGFGRIEITGMREAYKKYCGSDRIEDSYFFTTAEVIKNDGAKMIEC